MYPEKRVVLSLCEYHKLYLHKPTWYSLLPVQATHIPHVQYIPCVESICSLWDHCSLYDPPLTITHNKTFGFISELLLISNSHILSFIISISLLINLLKIQKMTFLSINSGNSLKTNCKNGKKYVYSHTIISQRHDFPMELINDIFLVDDYSFNPT